MTRHYQVIVTQSGGHTQVLRMSSATEADFLAQLANRSISWARGGMEVVGWYLLPA